MLTGVNEILLALTTVVLGPVALLAVWEYLTEGFLECLVNRIRG